MTGILRISGWCLTISNLPRMTPHQLSTAKKMIKKSCSYEDQGNCLYLDNGWEECACPQCHSYSVICKFFRNVVLKNYPEFEKEILCGPEPKRCTVCNNPIVSTARNVKYCPECAKIVRREKQRQRARKRRQSVRILEPKSLEP